MKVVIDGNIGSGKTTQLDLLEKKGWTVRREPIDSWPLREFTENPVRWSFLLHMKILQTFRPIETKRPVIYERSLASSRWVFWKVLRKRGYVTQKEHETYEAFCEMHMWQPDLYIFLDKNARWAYSHISKRGQVGDSGLSLEYLKELEIEYHALVPRMPGQVYVVNANRTVDEIHEEICRILSENELFVGDGVGDEMQTESLSGRPVSCTPFTDVCRVS